MRAYSISFAPFPISHDHFFNFPHQSRVPTINEIIFCLLHDHQSTILPKTHLTYENYLAQSAAKIEILNFSNNFQQFPRDLHPQREWTETNAYLSVFKSSVESLPRYEYFSAMRTLRDRRKFSITSFPRLQNRVNDSCDQQIRQKKILV